MSKSMISRLLEQGYKFTLEITGALEYSVVLKNEISGWQFSELAKTPEHAISSLEKQLNTDFAKSLTNNKF